MHATERPSRDLSDVIRVRVSKTTRDEFRTRALAEHRTESAQGRLLIEQYLADQERAA